MKTSVAYWIETSKLGIADILNVESKSEKVMSKNNSSTKRIEYFLGTPVLSTECDT